MRDYRRRRQSYRAKNVHITKKSYTEVIREVIDIHSGELGRIWQEVKDEEFKASQQSSHRGASEKGAPHLLSHVSLMSAPEASMGTNGTANTAAVVVASVVGRGKTKVGEIHTLQM